MILYKLSKIIYGWLETRPFTLTAFVIGPAVGSGTGGTGAGGYGPGGYG